MTTENTANATQNAEGKVVETPAAQATATTPDPAKATQDPASTQTPAEGTTETKPTEEKETRESCT